MMKFESGLYSFIFSLMLVLIFHKFPKIKKFMLMIGISLNLPLNLLRRVQLLSLKEIFRLKLITQLRKSVTAASSSMAAALLSPAKKALLTDSLFILIPSIKPI